MYQKRAYKLHPTSIKRKLLEELSESSQTVIPYLVGVTSVEHSGLDRFCNTLKKILGESSVLHISEEAYAKCLDHLPPEKRETASLTDPNFIDYDLLLNHMDDLSVGFSISIPKYDKHCFTRKKDFDFYMPRPIVIFSGKKIFSQELLEKKFNHKVFLDNLTDLAAEEKEVLALIERAIKRV